MGLEEFKEWAEQPALVATTAGLLVYNCKTHIIVGLSAHPDQIADMMKIPRCAIVGMKTLANIEI